MRRHKTKMFFIRSLFLGLLVAVVVGAAPWIPRGASLTDALSKEMNVGTQETYSKDQMPFQQRVIKNLALMEKLHLARDEAGYQDDHQPLTSEERILMKALQVNRTQTSHSPVIKKMYCPAGTWWCKTNGRRAFIPRPLPWQRQHETFQPRDPEEKHFGQRFSGVTYVNQ